MARLPQEGETPLGFSFLKRKFKSPLSLSGANRFLHLLFFGNFCLLFKNHHVNRTPVVETCCEEKKCKILCKNIAILPRRGQ